MEADGKAGRWRLRRNGARDVRRIRSTKLETWRYTEEGPPCLRGRLWFEANVGGVNADIRAGSSERMVSGDGTPRAPFVSAADIPEGGSGRVSRSHKRRGEGNRGSRSRGSAAGWRAATGRGQNGSRARGRGRRDRMDRRAGNRTSEKSWGLNQVNTYVDLIQQLLNQGQGLQDLFSIKLL